jgi:hypothetical protein
MTWRVDKDGWYWRYALKGESSQALFPDGTMGFIEADSNRRRIFTRTPQNCEDIDSGIPVYREKRHNRDHSK